MSEHANTCQESIADAGTRSMSFHLCGRKVYADGLCRLHWNVKQKRAQRSAEYDRQHQRSEQARADAQRRVGQLADLGIIANVHYRVPPGNGLGEYTGGVTLDAEMTARVIDALRAAQ